MCHNIALQYNNSDNHWRVKTVSLTLDKELCFLAIGNIWSMWSIYSYRIVMLSYGWCFHEYKCNRNIESRDCKTYYSLTDIERNSENSVFTYVIAPLLFSIVYWKSPTAGKSSKSRGGEFKLPKMLQWIHAWNIHTTTIQIGSTKWRSIIIHSFIFNNVAITGSSVVILLQPRLDLLP